MGEQDNPPRIVTADCSYPKEIDDGLFVRPLDEEHELYQVGVCVVDTAQIYKHQDIVDQAYERTTAKYWDLPGNERGYDPMIEPDVIKSLEFTAGSVREALIITFLVGRKQAPADVSVTFGPVEVVENKTYKDFANYAIYGTGKAKRFLRASEFIKNHLGYIAYGDHTGTLPQWREEMEANSVTVPNTSRQAWKQGSKMNEAFMVAANHLIGKLLADEGRPAIYRVHDPDDEQYIDMLSANVARYSRTPGPHVGLGLDPYCRVTSPLRRLDDFVMNNQLKKRFLGKDPTRRDDKDVAFAIRRLNQEVIASIPKEASRLSSRDILGKSAVRKSVLLQVAG